MIITIMIITIMIITIMIIIITNTLQVLKTKMLLVCNATASLD